MADVAWEIGIGHGLAALLFGVVAFVLIARRQQSFVNMGVAFACFISMGWALSVVLAARFSADTFETANILNDFLNIIRQLAWIAIIARFFTPAQDKAASTFTRKASILWIAVILGCILFLLVLLKADIALSVKNQIFIFSNILVGVLGLVLASSVYFNVTRDNRWGVRFLCVGLALGFGYDLNAYSWYFLTGQYSVDLFVARGGTACVVAILVYFSAQRNHAWKVHFSQRVVLHSLSLMIAGGYLIAMAALGYFLRLYAGDLGGALQAFLLSLAVASLALLLLSGQFRAAIRIWLAKNFQSYRYDYREEWLRVIDTMSHANHVGEDLSVRAIRAVCDTINAPGGILLIAQEHGPCLEQVAHWNMRGGAPLRLAKDTPLLQRLESTCSIVDLDMADGMRSSLSLPDQEDRANLETLWLAIPLIHLEDMVGVVLIRRSLAARELNWEDVNLLCTVGRQAASYLAEDISQKALSESQKFDEFNRRFAFIIHDIKNLVSQLDMLVRNIDRHIDNPDFRLDMVVTLNASVSKMKYLLHRLTRKNMAPVEMESLDLLPLVRTIVHDMKAVAPGVELESAAGEDFTACVDPERFDEVFRHIIQNALDASAETTTTPVRVVMTRQNGDLSIAVVDKGCGMSPDFVRHHLFEPFHSTKSDGFGIGVYEVREVMRSFGGRMEVASTQGEGSSFTLFLPPVRHLAQTSADTSSEKVSA